MRPLAMAPYPVLLPQTPRLLWRLRGDLALWLFLFLLRLALPTALTLARIVIIIERRSVEHLNIRVVFRLSLLALLLASRKDNRG